MGSIIDALERLQDIERALAGFRAKEETLQRQVKNVERRIQKCRDEKDAQHSEVSQRQQAADRAELDIKSIEASLDKQRQALNAAKSNREYAAILTTINTQKADSSKLETQVLQLMSEIDQLKTGEETFGEEESKLLERLAEVQGKLDAYRAKIKPELDQLMAKRDEAAENVPAAIFDIFRRVAEHHEGQAMAEVTRLNPRALDFVCSGCNMSVPLELVNSLHGRDEVNRCNSCGRILYLKTEKK